MNRRRKSRRSVGSIVKVAPQIVPVDGNRQDVDMADDLLDTKAVAAMLGLNSDTLIAWRTRGKGPAYVEIGDRAIRYRRSDITSWVNAQRVVPGGAT